MKSAKAISVKQDPAQAVPTEVLAQSIVTIAEGVRKLRRGSLTDSALFLLVQAAAPGRRRMSLEDIRTVFAGIDNLDAQFIRKVKPKK